MEKLTRMLVVCLICASQLVQAQLLNEEHALAIEKEDISKLMTLYADDAVLLPEFHPPVYGKHTIEAYYKHRFENSAVREYKRTMHDSKQFEDYVIETGTLSYTLFKQGEQSHAYSGNYIVVWKADKHLKLHMLAEIWGSDKSLTRDNSFAASGGIVREPSGDKHKIDPEVRQQIDARTAEIEAAVKKRDGLALAKLYTKDAIYIPYYSPMMVGDEHIRNYYVKHEDPAVAIDSIKIQPITFWVVRDIVIATTEYGVRWKAGDNSGTVTGKNLNIWRRGKDGKYLLFRQMANHD